MTKVSLFLSSLACACLGVSSPAFAQATGTVVFNNIPSPVPGNVTSLGFECCSTAEFGDQIALEADTPRRAGYATVLMSSWSLHSDYPTLAAAGYTHPITLALYTDAVNAANHAPMATVTQTFTIPWRPDADPACAGGTAWRFDATHCYNGLAFTIVFDLRALNLTLPDEFIYGVAYNTRTWGYAPLGVSGPYDSLNVGLARVDNVAVPVTVGTDVVPDEVYWNSSYGPFYTDGGVGGIGILRPDTGWTGFAPATRFTTFAIAVTRSDCRNGGWANLVRADFTPFRNQRACVDYVEHHGHDRGHDGDGEDDHDNGKDKDRGEDRDE